MLLNWKKNNLKVVELVPTTAEAKKVKLKKSTITLLPGINEISDDEYLVAKPHLQDNLDAGTLVEVKEKTQTFPGKPQQDATTLNQVPAKKAKQLIKETHSPETLYKWLATETRTDIRNNVEDRLKELGLDTKIPEGLDVDLDEEQPENKGKKGKKEENDEE